LRSFAPPTRPALKITYSGTMTSADEIAFTRNVADLANEKLVTKRVK